MQLIRRVVTIGNSLGVTFPKEFVKKNRIKAGTSVVAEIVDGEIKFLTQPKKASTYQPVSDQEFMILIKDIEKQYGGALKKLARLP
mgnify:CR=1 FL=1